MPVGVGGDPDNLLIVREHERISEQPLGVGPGQTEVARAIAGTHADLATTEWSKAKRRGVLIDASQNAKGKSIASVYSVRPMPGATVSTPLHWDEVNETLDPSIYTMEMVLDRLERHGDLYEGVLKTRQRLGPALHTLEAGAGRQRPMPGPYLECRPDVRDGLGDLGAQRRRSHAEGD